MKQTRVGFALCGSYCTYDKVLAALKTVTKCYEHVVPIMSENSAATDSRYGTAQSFRTEIETLCGRPVLKSITEVEPIGPQRLLDVLVIAPCTGNTLAKMAHGVTDTAVTMAAKAHLRNGRPVVIAVATNDGLGVSAANIGTLLCRKHIYFVPFRQDDPEAKPNSLAAEMSLIPDAIEAALRGEQLQPVLL
jgi:dipicolinate synthase subunit B